MKQNQLSRSAVALRAMDHSSWMYDVVFIIADSRQGLMQAHHQREPVIGALTLAHQISRHHSTSLEVVWWDMHRYIREVVVHVFSTRISYHCNVEVYRRLLEYLQAIE